MTEQKKVHRLILVMIILTSFVGCDQATKRVATQTLQNSEPKSYLGDTVRLDFALNSGGFLSLGSQLPPAARWWVFIGINMAFMIAITMFLLFNHDAGQAVFISLAYILAGGIGNLIDRIANNGQVIDFLNIGIGTIRTGIFNVADVGVMAGTLVLFFAISSNGTRDDINLGLTK